MLTVHVLKDVEDGKNLSVVRDQRFTHHLCWNNQMLQNLQRGTDDLSVPCVQGIWRQIVQRVKRSYRKQRILAMCEKCLLWTLMRYYFCTFLLLVYIQNLKNVSFTHSVRMEEGVNSRKKLSSASCMISHNPMVQWLVERITERLKEIIKFINIHFSMYDLISPEK